MKYLPIGLDLRGRTCLAVGGGETALDKVRILVRAGASIRVVSPDIEPGFDALEGVTKIKRTFEPDDLDGMSLVIAATNDEAVNEEVARLCEARGILCNAVDAPELCHFIMPAILERGDVLVSVLTSGAAPGLAARLRDDIKELLPDKLEAYVDFLRQTRLRLKHEGLEVSVRWEVGRCLASREGYERYARLGGEGLEAWVQEVVEAVARDL